MNENRQGIELSQQQILEVEEKLKAMYLNHIKKLPTFVTFNDEFDVSWDIIAGCFNMTRNGFKRHRETAHTWLKSYGELMKVFEDAVNEQAKVFDRLQPNRAKNLRRDWSKNKARYRELLENAHEADEWFFFRDETDHIEIWLKERRCIELLEKVKPAFEKLELGRALKLAFHYEGYAALGYLPFLGCIAVMTPAAQAELKGEMDAMTAPAAEHLALLARNAGTISHCVAIRYEDSSRENWGMSAAWREFKAQAQAHGNFNLLTVAVLLLFFHIDDIEPHELDMVMTYAFCLTSEQRRDALEMAKGMLTAGNLREPHKAAELAELFAADDMEQYMEQLLGIDPIA